MDLIPRWVDAELDPKFFTRKQRRTQMVGVDDVLHIARKQLVDLFFIYFFTNRHVSLFYHENKDAPRIS